MTEDNDISVAIACQGGGSHTAFTAGVLTEILRNCPERYEIESLSGTSGGAICAALAWDGLRRDDTPGAIARLEGFWSDIATTAPWDRLTNEWAVATGRLAGNVGTFGVSPYRNPLSTTARAELAQAIERFVEFDDDDVRSAPPHLFVGAVDVESGSFTVFEDGDEEVSALLASAAIPTLFRAVAIDGTGHWDGLFSQNPPIRQFTKGVPAHQKPDEIWVVRINPTARNETPRSLTEIVDRRNELSGNLSLEQEKHMIESINDLIAEGVVDDERYKHIELREVQLSGSFDLPSKLDRSPAFLDDLLERGRENASRFWD